MYAKVLKQLTAALLTLDCCFRLQKNVDKIAKLLLRKSRSYGVVWNSRVKMMTTGIPNVEILVVRLFVFSMF